MANKYSLFFLLLLVIPSFAHAATYDESTNGDLATSSQSHIIINSTYTTVSGSVDNNDSDYFLIQVGAGETLNSITLTAAFGADATVSLFDGMTTSDTALIGGFPVWNDSNVGGNFLTAFGSPAPGALSTAKKYLFGFWHNNTAAISYTLTLNFTTSSSIAVSAPIPLVYSLFAGFLIGIFALFGIRRRNKL